jgi:hypothetical protein
MRSVGSPTRSTIWASSSLEKGLRASDGAHVAGRLGSGHSVETTFVGNAEPTHEHVRGTCHRASAQVGSPPRTPAHWAPRLLPNRAWVLPQLSDLPVNRGKGTLASLTPLAYAAAH